MPFDYFVVVEHWKFEYDNVITLKIRFFFSPRVCSFLFFKAIVIHLFNDFSQVFLQRLHSLLCVVTEISIPLACV